MEYERLNRHGGFKGTVLQRLAEANVLQLYFQWKHEHMHRYVFIQHIGTWQREAQLVL